jgi:hypothetical protein
MRFHAWHMFVPSLFLFLTNLNPSFGSTMQDFGNDSLPGDSLFYLPPHDPGQTELPHHELIPEKAEPWEEVIPQQDQDNAMPKWYTMFTKIPTDWSLLTKRTFRAESIPILAGIAGLTGALYIIDRNTYRNTHEYERRSGHMRSLSDALISVGDGIYQVGFIGSFAVYGFITDDSHVLRSASQMTEAVLATGIVVQVMKRISGRESPIVATQDRGAVRPFPNLFDYQQHQPKYYSFPSGHIATTTAALTVLCENFPEAKWLRPVSYITVGALGGSLVSKGWHWYSDLPLGIALGYSFGIIAAHPEELDVKKSTEDNSLDLGLAPRFMSNGAELEMTVHF